jgi:hypothetical protein
MLKKNGDIDYLIKNGVFPKIKIKFYQIKNWQCF